MSQIAAQVTYFLRVITGIRIVIERENQKKYVYTTKEQQKGRQMKFALSCMTSLKTYHRK